MNGGSQLPSQATRPRSKAKLAGRIMIPLLALAVVVIVLLNARERSASLAPASSPPSDHRPSAKSKEPRAAALDEGEYLEVDPAVYPALMELKGAVRWDADGTPRFDGEGRIQRFSVRGNDLMLTSTVFENGFVCTKDYGRIRVIGSYNGFAIRLTQKQAKALAKLPLLE